MSLTSWVDRAAYPFEPRYFAVDGARIHYVDEGEGQPIVMVHGTLTWSFLYRDLIRTLAPRYPCIVPDHLGYGLSDKPEHVAYRPEDRTGTSQSVPRITSHASRPTHPAQGKTWPQAPPSAGSVGSL